jgi:hypothetical protein
MQEIIINVIGVAVLLSPFWLLAIAKTVYEWKHESN